MTKTIKKLEQLKKIYFVIENDKEIDPRAFTLMGASTKRDDDSKIGFFGSGNKYAIALLMRENIHFKVFSGKKEIVFEKKVVSFNKRRYEVIIIDGKETSLTTEMGPNWISWFAIREFYSNALDEGNARLNVSDKFQTRVGRTRIYIERTPALSEFFSNMQHYILTNNINRLARVKTNYGDVSLINKLDDKNLIFYRKGIRIEKREEDCLYWYDFDDIEINESRTTKNSYEPSERIASFFANTEDEGIIRNFIKNYRGKYEKNLHWNYANGKLSSTWAKILEGKRVVPLNIAILSGDAEMKENSIILPDGLAEKIFNEMPQITVVGFSDSTKYSVLEKTQPEKDLISACVTKMEKFGYIYNKEVLIANFYENDLVGLWDKKSDVIVLSRKHFPHTVDELLNTMMEEYFHSTGQVDGRRSFVTFLIDEIINIKNKI